MTDQTTPSEGGEFTRADAVAAIKAMDAPQETTTVENPAAAPVEAAPEPEDDQSEAVPTAEDEPGQGAPATGDEEAEPADQEAPVIDYPRSWAAEDREVFAALPEDARTIILARENQRDSAVSKAQKEASDARRAAATEVSKLTELKPQIEGLIERASKTFADQWSNIDWVAWAQQDPGAAMAGKFQMEQERDELARLGETQKTVNQLEIQKFTEAEAAKLPEVCPDLADPKEGPARRKSVAEFLLKQGITYDQLPNVSAVEMSIAYDAMRFRQRQTPPPLKAPTSPALTKTPPARPAASPSRSPDNELATAKRRFAQTGSREDAVAIMKLQGM